MQRYKMRFRKEQGGQFRDTGQPSERMFSFTASKEYVPTTPTSKTDAPICVVEGTAQGLSLFVLELACHDSIITAATITVLKNLLTIIEENFPLEFLFSHKKNFYPNFLHFLESSLRGLPNSHGAS